MRIALAVAALILLASLPSAQTVDPGRATFVNRCAGCHGTDGNGGELGPGIATRVPPLSDQDLTTLLKEGRPALGMPPSAWPVLMATLALGTGSLSMLGGVGAALTVSVRRGSVLLALLVLPLEMPVLIFGARAVDLAMHGESVAGPLNLLAALLLFFVSLGPFAMAAAMRVSVES